MAAVAAAASSVRPSSTASWYPPSSSGSSKELGVLGRVGLSQYVPSEKLGEPVLRWLLDLSTMTTPSAWTSGEPSSRGPVPTSRREYLLARLRRRRRTKRTRTTARARTAMAAPTPAMAAELPSPPSPLLPPPPDPVSEALAEAMRGSEGAKMLPPEPSTSGRAGEPLPALLLGLVLPPPMLVEPSPMTPPSTKTAMGMASVRNLSSTMPREMRRRTSSASSWTTSAGASERKYRARLPFMW
mmetsp:Transcript_22595/g.53552  ORF Transcript_22595/g.53552 Transcript_22595/m.53552 type:complete len:242 (-) Transcript_22595:1082-1807(-)